MKKIKTKPWSCNENVELILAEPETPEWHHMRKGMITGTRMAAILGLNPYMQPIEVYLEMIGKGKPVEETDAMWWGKRLEEPVLDRFRVEHEDKNVVSRGAKPVHTGFFRLKDHPTIGVTIDGLAIESLEGGDVIEYVEAKTSRFAQFKHEGKMVPFPESGQTDFLPTQYLIQMMTGCSVLQLEKWWMPTLLQTNDYREYWGVTTKEYSEKLIETAERWVRDHVVAKKPPKVTGAPSRIDVMQLLYPQETSQELRSATDEEITLAYQLKTVTADIKAADETKKEIIVQLKDLIKEAPGIFGQFGRIHWKLGKSSTKWKDAFNAFGNSVAEELTKMGVVLDLNKHAIWAAEGCKSKPSRKFIPKLVEEE